MIRESPPAGASGDPGGNRFSEKTMLDQRVEIIIRVIESDHDLLKVGFESHGRRLQRILCPARLTFMIKRYW